MNLVKWFRKNRNKAMAVVAIGTLISFMGLGTFLQFISQRRTGLHKTVAYFGDNKKITNYDIVLAREELTILESVWAGELLRNIGIPLFNNVPDLRAALLGELLFSERRTSPTLVNFIKRTIRTSNYRISDKQISDIYKRTVPSEVYWYCLKEEARLAGVRVSNEDARRLLVNAIPQMPRFEGATYFQLIGSAVRRLGVPEEKILTAFSKLLAVFEYAKTSCSGEDVTTSQIMRTVSLERETIDVNFVQFDSAFFVEAENEPNQERLLEHFNKYKNFFAGDVNEANPYGFGYKLVDRVQLEYIACRLDGVSEIVTPPTHQEAEEFYRKNREQFTEEVLSDPNDPNSMLTERIKGYAEVADIISKGLLKNKIDLKARSILEEAKTLTEAGLQDLDAEAPDISAEGFKKLAGDYGAAAEELSKKYKIKVYCGKTGLLDSEKVQLDDYLGRLYLRGYGNAVVGLTKMVFAIEELGLSELGPFDIPKPKMYRNIGPVRDILERIMVLVRVIDVEKASEPESINQTFSTSTPKFSTADEHTDKGDANHTPAEDLDANDVYSVKEKVAQDLKRLSAMEVTKKKAEEFIGLAAKEGWDSTIDKFNGLYGRKGGRDEDDPNLTGDPNATEGPEEPFHLQSATKLQRISRGTIGRLAVLSEGNPGSPLFVSEAQKWLSVRDAKIAKQFIDQLYSLVPQDSNTVDTLPLIMAFKPDMSYYCIKEIRVRRVVREEYEQSKPIEVYKEEYIQFQSMAAVHFNPENILKRANFRWVREKERAKDANTPVESKEESL